MFSGTACVPFPPFFSFPPMHNYSQSAEFGYSIKTSKLLSRMWGEWMIDGCMIEKWVTSTACPYLYLFKSPSRAPPSFILNACMKKNGQVTRNGEGPDAEPRREGKNLPLRFLFFFSFLFGFLLFFWIF